MEYALSNAVLHAFERRILEKLAYTIKAWQGPNLDGISEYLDNCQADFSVVCRNQQSVQRAFKRRIERRKSPDTHGVIGVLVNPHPDVKSQ